MDTRRRIVLTFAIVTVLILFQISLVYAQSTVATATNSSATQYPFQTKSFYANTRFWAYYSDGTNMVWKSTTDPTDWSGSATIIGAQKYGYTFSVVFDGTYVHYARAERNYVLYYRRGIPESNGTITYSAAEQTVYSGLYNDHYDFPQIAIDDSGYAWIGAKFRTGNYYYPYALLNANNDGTWSTSSSTKLHTDSVVSWIVKPVSLTDQKMYVIYAYATTSGGYAYGKLWTGSFGSQETCNSNGIQVNYGISATNEGDNVHFAYLRYDTYQIRYRLRTYGGSPAWGTDTLVQNSVTTSTCPSLSIETATNNVYCFWMDLPTADHIYYAIRYSSNSSWSSAVDWIDESSDTILSGNNLNCFYKSYGGYIGVLYSTKTSSPYNLKFAYLSFAIPKEWNLVEIWKGNLLGCIWYPTETWKINLYNFSWFLTETWKLNLHNYAWFPTESWFTELSSRIWSSAETWLTSLHNYAWFLTESWKTNIHTLKWFTTEMWNVLIRNPMWYVAEWWNMNIHTLGWFCTEVWNVLVRNPTWLTIESWFSSVRNFTWFEIEKWLVSIGTEMWNITETWFASIRKCTWFATEIWQSFLHTIGWYMVQIWQITLTLETSIAFFLGALSFIFALAGFVMAKKKLGFLALLGFVFGLGALGLAESDVLAKGLGIIGLALSLFVLGVKAKEEKT